MNEPTEPLIFKLFEDFLTAEKILKSFEHKPPTPQFEQKVRMSYNHISTLLDAEIDKYANVVGPDSTSSSPL